MSDKNYFNNLSRLIFKIFADISPLQGLFLGITIFSTNIYAALPLEKAAEQQNICSQELGGNHKAA
jgi:hypothetical protein